VCGQNPKNNSILNGSFNTILCSSNAIIGSGVSNRICVPGESDIVNGSVILSGDSNLIRN
jgi:hypothetical protein